jgi:hypothetical protein
MGARDDLAHEARWRPLPASLDARREGPRGFGPGPMGWPVSEGRTAEQKGTLVFLAFALQGFDLAAREELGLVILEVNAGAVRLCELHVFERGGFSIVGDSPGAVRVRVLLQSRGLFERIPRIFVTLKIDP